MSVSKAPLFAVVIATRNRASLFAVALQSVLEQRFQEFEVVVVNDGSSDEHRRQYHELIEKVGGQVRILDLPQTDNGHGPSYCLNQGARTARGAYLCFVDDDDQWTDPEHLGRVASVIARSAPKPDLILANQRAYLDGEPVSQVIWIEDLNHRLRGSPDESGAYTVTTSELLKCRAHCHRNTTIVSHSFYQELGGLDDEMRYEEDRDFYLRAIDRAALIKFLPFTVSRHNIPAASGGASASTIPSAISKRLYQLRVFEKAILFSTRPELRQYAMRQRGYILKHIATDTGLAGQLDCATYYAKQALATQFTLRWCAAVMLFTLRRWLARTRTNG